MKHIKYFFVIFFCCLVISCGKKEIQTDIFADIKQICDLAVFECYYHNNAECEKEEGFMKKRTKQWIEYSSVIKIGIDASEIEIEVVDSDVKIVLPEAKIIGEPKIELDSIKILTEKGYFMQNITNEDQVFALKIANDNAKDTTKNNGLLMSNAQNRVKQIIENYIKQIGDLCKKEYKIEWKVKRSTFE